MPLLIPLKMFTRARGRSGAPAGGGRLRFGRAQAGWIGVDLGTSSIKLAQVERRNAEWRMSGSTVVPAAAVSDNLLDEPVQHELRRAVRRGLTFRGRMSAAALPQSLLDSRTLDLPDGSLAELRQIIAQELADDDGAASDGREFAFWKAPVMPESRSASAPAAVTVLSIRQAAAMQVAERLLASGLHCEVLDAPPFALARAVRLAAPDLADEPQSALDWGFNSTVFTLVLNGRPAFTRVFRDCGLRHLLDSVAGGLRLSPAEARQVLSSCGVPPSPSGTSAGRVQTALGELAAPVLNRLAEELRRTLAFLRQQSGSAPVRIWLCGGGGLIRNVSERLTGETGLSTECWRLPRSASDERPRDSAECLFATAAALSVLRWENSR